MSEFHLGDNGGYPPVEDDLIPGQIVDQNGEYDWDRDAAVTAEYAEGWYSDYGTSEALKDAGICVCMIDNDTVITVNGEV